MKRTLLILLVALAALALLAAKAGPSAQAYSSTDNCDTAHTFVDKLGRQSFSAWHLYYYFDCPVGDGPRVGLQRKGCDTCAFSTIYSKSTTNGEGLGNLNYTHVDDIDPADQCVTDKYYRMFLQWYDSGVYHIDYSPWRQGTAWNYCN